MVTVRAAEFQKQFGKFREMALREPVSVTHHGRTSLVMISAQEYERLKSLDSRVSLHPADLPADAMEALDEELSKLKDVEAAALVPEIKP